MPQLAFILFLIVLIVGYWEEILYSSFVLHLINGVLIIMQFIHDLWVGN